MPCPVPVSRRCGRGSARRPAGRWPPPRSAARSTGGASTHDGGEPGVPQQRRGCGPASSSVHHRAERSSTDTGRSARRSRMRGQLLPVGPLRGEPLRILEEHGAEPAGLPQRLERLGEAAPRLVQRRRAGGGWRRRSACSADSGSSSSCRSSQSDSGLVGWPVSSDHALTSMREAGRRALDPALGQRVAGRVVVGAVHLDDREPGARRRPAARPPSSSASGTSRSP